MQHHKTKIFIIIFFLILFCLIFGYWFLKANSIWDGRTKFTIAIQNPDATVTVQIFDPTTSTETQINIPAQTQVDAANNLGTWKLGSITKLGADKGLDKNFLKNTIIKSFAFPIDTSSPLSIFDKLQIRLFNFSVGQAGKTEINLQNSNYLARSKLADSSLGWEIGDNVPPEIASYFSQNFGQNINVLINNESGSVTEGNTVAKTVNVMGLNVTSIQNLTSSNFDCKITGQNQKAISAIAEVLSCQKSFAKAQDNFDIQIDIGKVFAQRI